MMRLYLYFIPFILCYYAEGAQPYFPPQIVFSDESTLTTYAIDEINQRAFANVTFGATGREVVYAMSHFPYSIPDTPQSENYVQLVVGNPAYKCLYSTYWKYGGINFNRFPAHWLVNGSFKIGSYMKYTYDMIHSNDSSTDEDHWYANTTCHGWPCEEIYFKKNTDIPLRFIRVTRRAEIFVRVTSTYNVISIGKPDEKYFNSIPQDWMSICRDVNLGLAINPRFVRVNLSQSVELSVFLIAPPHRINGNDTVRIRWKAYECLDCITWTPTDLFFSGNNFEEKQILTITRVKNALQAYLLPICSGGNYEYVQPDSYNIGFAYN